MPYAVGIERVTTGRVSYHAALGFVYALINLLPQRGHIETAKVATDLYNRYLIPPELTIEKWKKDFALACSIALKYGDLEKVKKGVYLVTDRWGEDTN